jgi:putative nucleotidyltransferase-like protein
MTLALDEKVAALDRALRAARIPHAFGGAIALAYYATPRGTQDVDVNLFVPASDLDRVLGVLAPLGVSGADEIARRAAEREGQVRVHWDETPLDLFFAYDALHDACRERRRSVPFVGEQIAILSPEDLAIFKVLFARDKDWRDLRELLFAQGERFDGGYVQGWLERILAPGDARLARFRSLLA